MILEDFLMIGGAALAVVVGFGLMAWRGRARFKRTNAQGVQEHDSYAGMLGSKAIDGVAMLVAVVLVFCGGLFLIMLLLGWLGSL